MKRVLSISALMICGIAALIGIKVLDLPALITAVLVAALLISLICGLAKFAPSDKKESTESEPPSQE